MGSRHAGGSVGKALAFCMAIGGALVAECRVWTEATSGEAGETITVVVKAVTEEPVIAFDLLFRFDVKAFALLDRDFSQSEAARHAQVCGGDEYPAHGLAVARIVSAVPWPSEGLFALGREWELVRFHLRVRPAAAAGAHAAGIVETGIVGSNYVTVDNTAFVAMDGRNVPIAIIPGEAIVRAPTHPAPPAGFACSRDPRGARLSWLNPIAYEQILVARDGVLLAALAGNAETFVDEEVTEGPHAYAVRGCTSVDATVAVECRLVVGPPKIDAPVYLACVENGEYIKLSWWNPRSYDGIEVRRNGETVASLPGGARSFLDTEAPAGMALYQVVGRAAEIGSAPATCAIRGQWVLRLGSAVADPVTRIAALPVYVSNPMSIVGYSIVLGADPAEISVEGASFEGCVPGRLLPFMSGEIIGSTYAIFWGVFMAPTVQVLPPAIESRFLTVFLRVAPDVPAGAVLPITLDEHSAHTPHADIVIVAGHPDTAGGDVFYPTLIHGEVIVGDAAVPPVRDLRACADRGGLSIAWRNGGGYDRVEVEHDGALLAVLPGDAESIDAAPAGAAGAAWCRVRGAAGGVASPWTSVVHTDLPGVALFRRGDANADGSVNVADAIAFGGVLFLGESSGCEDALDCDDDGVVGVPDVLSLLSYLFATGAEPSSPGPRVRWFDPTPDSLGCGEGTP